MIVTGDPDRHELRRVARQQHVRQVPGQEDHGHREDVPADPAAELPELRGGLHLLVDGAGRAIPDGAHRPLTEPSSSIFLDPGDVPRVPRTATTTPIRGYRPGAFRRHVGRPDESLVTAGDRTSDAIVQTVPAQAQTLRRVQPQEQLVRRRRAARAGREADHDHHEERQGDADDRRTVEQDVPRGVPPAPTRLNRTAAADETPPASTPLIAPTSVSPRHQMPSSEQRAERGRGDGEHERHRLGEVQPGRDQREAATGSTPARTVASGNPSALRPAPGAASCR